MNTRIVILGIVIVVAAFIGATLLMNLLWPSSLQEGRPQLVAVPPLPPLAGTSTVLAPAAIAMSAIRKALEAEAPRNLSGHPQNPVSQLLQEAELNFTIARGPLALTGRPDSLVVSTALNGTFQARGTLTDAAGALGNTLGNMLGGNLGQQVQGLAGKAFDQHADFRGTVTAVSRPSIGSNWRLAPNLTAQVNVVDVVLPIAGVKLSVSNEVRPVLDNMVREQTGTLESRVRNDPFIENAARANGQALPRHFARQGGQGVRDLWLEIRTMRAIAAQPKIDANAVTLLVGVQSETRIVPNETKPKCRLPAQLDIVPQANEGTLDIAVPIDIPFPEVSRLIEAQVKGKTFPEDGSGSFATTIKQAVVAASGDRLLISLLVNVKKRGLFALGADATVHVWGKPVLDQNAQILRFTDVALDVQSQAAFALGEAAKAAVPYLQKTLAEQAVIDLKPFAEDAKKRMAAAAAEFTGQAAASPPMSRSTICACSASRSTPRIRVVADAKGNVNVAISSLAWQ